MTLINIAVDLETVHCGECGGTYAINRKYWGKKQRYGGFWTCPYCACSWGFPQHGTELARVKRKLEYQEAESARQREMRERTERSLSATRGVLTRTKNRIGKGVCPCCNRSFTDLHRHMQTKHPKYAESD